jgi:TPR repeat protein
MKLIGKMAMPMRMGMAVMSVAAALLWGAAAAHAAPPEIHPEQPKIAPSIRFQEGVTAYDQGDFKRAFDIWLPLAQGGDLAAMRNVALLMRKGEGTVKDPKRALWFYEEAGRKGFALAQLNAAFMYLEGDGIPKELDAAAFWFHEAALAGSPIAQYNLGVMYEGGLGIDKDLPRALGWYALAARSGNQHAMDRLAVLVPALPGPKPPSPADKPLAKVAPEPPPAIFEMRGSELQ